MSTQNFAKNRIVLDLSDTQVEQLFSAGSVTRIDKDKTAVHEEQTLDSVYVLLDGEALVFLPESENRLAQVDLTTLTTGDFFGEYTFIDQQQASASVKALTDCKLYSISHDVFRTYLEQNKDAGYLIYRNLLSVLVERMRNNNAELDLFNFS